MECKQTINLLNGYVDDMISWKESALVDEHLRICSQCACEYHQLKSLKVLMRSLKRQEPPSDLALRTQIRASKQNIRLVFERAFDRVDDFLRPIAIPAFSGVALTAVFFIILLSTLFTGTNLNASDRDVPLGLVTEPRARSLYISQFVQLVSLVTVREPITVEADVGTDGRIIDYKILNGPRDRATVRSLDEFFFFEVSFDPATSFGRPTHGKIILSLVFFPTSNNEINVMG
jgi:putative zinc finger protein